MADGSKIPELIAYREFALLDARLSAATGTNWDVMSPLYQELNQRRKELNLPVRGEGDPELGGFFWGHEELSGLWITGEVREWPFAWMAIDFIVDQLSCHSPLANLSNCHQLGAHFGPEIVGMVFDLIEGGMASFRSEFRRCETTEEVEEDDEESGVMAGEERTVYAPLDTTDDRFDEALYSTCQENDFGATLISTIDIDLDAFQGLEEEIMARERRAQKARRSEQ